MTCLHFQQNAHASGALISSSQAFVCIHETSAPATNFFSYLRILFVVLVIALSACVRLPRHHSSNRVAIETPNSESELSTININTASAAELEKLTGIGQVLAQRIVIHREEHGPFRRPEHLMMVRGISDRKFREIRSMLAVE